MREAAIILPNADNDGQPIAHIHDALAKDLCHLFGGFTATPSQGGWVSPDTGDLYREPGTLYSVAMVDDEQNAAALRALAGRYARVADQECVYIREPGGLVDFIEPEREKVTPWLSTFERALVAAGGGV